MFCPKCKYEYVESIKECPDCKMPLVEELPPEPEPAFVELVTVFAAGNPATIAVAKSILEDAGIRYFAKGENLQDLFTLGTFGTRFNPLMGPVQIQVAKDDAETARELLKDLK